MFKKIFFFSLFSVAFFMLSAQQSNIQLLDLGVEPAENISQIADVQMEVFFKIDHPDLAQTVFVDFGTTQNGNDVASFTAQIVPDGSGYAISYNGVNYPINENTYHAKFVVTLSQQQYHDFNFITLKVLDNSGLYSNSLSLGSN